MPQPLLQELFRFLRRTRVSAEGTNISDGALLERFVAESADTAFEMLMQRHGPMVLGVCQRIAGDAHAAEDAFQATFFVLAKRASAIRKQASIGSWLHGVALRIACRAKAQQATRRDRERRAALMPEREQLDELTWQELRDVLDEEIGQLPEKYRAAVVLCYLEGKSHEQAAQELGWPKRTTTNRLARARELLRSQLVRRGLTLSAGALTTALADKATAAPVAAGLIINGTKAAALLAAGKSVAGNLVSAQALILAEEAMKGMIGIKTKMALSLVALGLAVGAGLAAHAAWVGNPPPDDKQPPVVHAAPARQDTLDNSAKDLHDDPLPAGAVARLGQDRWLHGIMARFATFLPDGKTVVTINVDRTIRVWEFPSGKEIRRIALPTQDLSSANNTSGRTAALSKDGKTIATWRPEEPSAICLHDLATGKQLPGLVLPEVAKERGLGGVGKISALAFSPDGKHLAVAARNGEVRIWDWAKAKEVRSFAAGKPIEEKTPFSKSQSSGIAYAPDGKSLATFTSRDGAVKLWNPDTGVEIRTIRSEGITGVFTLAFSPDGKTLALAAHTGGGGIGDVSKASIVLVETATGKEIAKLNMPEPFQLGGAVFGKDGSKLYVSDYGGFVTEWDVASRKLLRECKPWPNLTAITTGGSIAVSPDGKTLIGIGTGPPFRDLAGKDITAVESRNPSLISLQFTPDGKSILTLSHELLTREVYPFPEAQSVRRWDAATGKDLGKVGVPPFSGPTATSPDGKVVAAAFPRQFANVGPQRITVETKAATTILVDPATGTELGKIPVAADIMRFSPDGKILAVRAGKKIELYGVPNAKLRHTVDLLPAIGVKRGMFYTLLFSPDGKMLAAPADSRTLGLWDTTTGQRIGSVPLPQDSKLLAVRESQFMESATFSTDGRCLILDRDDGTALLYELATAQPRRPFGKKLAAPPALPIARGIDYLFPDEVKAGCCFAFSPDGRLLVRGGFDRVVHVYDIQTGAELAAFQGHDGAVTSVAFAPNGKTLASASLDGTALIWDLTKLKRPSLVVKVLQPGDLENHWQTLAGNDAAKAFDAIGDLAADPTNTVAFLKDKLKPAQVAEPNSKTRGLLLQGDELRSFRAVEVLERIGTPAGRQLLQTLASGAPGAILTTSAQAALKR